MSLVKPGKYAAHPERLSDDQFADVYENDNGNLILRMAFRLDDSGHILHHFTMLAKNGELKIKTIDELKARYGWDGLDPFWFVNADLSGVQVEAVIEDEPDQKDPNKIWSRIKWINTPGVRGGGSQPRQVDRRAISTKYGSLFRAVAGPQPMKPAAPTKSQPPKAATSAPPKTAPAAPSTPARSSSLNECWDRMCTAFPNSSQDELASFWFEYQKEAVPGKTQDDFTAADWGRVMDRIEKAAKVIAEDNLPY